MKMIRFGRIELMVNRIAFGGIPIMRLPKPEAAHLVRESINNLALKGRGMLF